MVSKLTEKLYTVSVTYDYVVVAKDLDDAYKQAWDNILAVRDLPEDAIDMLVSQGWSQDNCEWDGNWIPFGGDGIKKTKDYNNEEES